MNPVQWIFRNSIFLIYKLQFIIYAVKSFSHITIVLYTKIPQMKKMCVYPYKNQTVLMLLNSVGEGKAYFKK